MSTAATDLLRDFEALFARTEVVDLSAVLEEGAPIWPTHPPLIIHRTVTHERHGYFTNSIFMPEHVGTHCDAPAHAVPELMDQTIDRFPIDQMVGPACVIDVSARNLDAGEDADRRRHHCLGIRARADSPGRHRPDQLRLVQTALAHRRAGPLLRHQPTRPRRSRRSSSSTNAAPKPSAPTTPTPRPLSATAIPSPPATPTRTISCPTASP